ncbi:hypothetical protein BU9_CDS0065 [Klebsiella phage Kpn BU9]|nr:hypothetical protein BU9_CDS0065 [Klebsiella phage Kpn BU9]DAV78112.1 MAG TPA: hypothetical protein [Caudoviricetes sp.]
MLFSLSFRSYPTNPYLPYFYNSYINLYYL